MNGRRHRAAASVSDESIGVGSAGARHCSSLIYGHDAPFLER
jgi:hypothetical protein